MKFSSLFCLTILLAVIVKQGQAQEKKRLTLSDPFPKTGETISISYDTRQKSSPAIKPKVLVIFLDNALFPAADVPLKFQGHTWKGTFYIPRNTEAFCVKINVGEKIDNNDGKGYVFNVYQNKNTVKGAYASEAVATGLFADMFGIKKNMEAAATLFKKEFRLHPDMEDPFEDLYLLTLYYSKPADQLLASTRAMMLAQSGVEEPMIHATNYFRHIKKTAVADSLLTSIHQKFSNGQERKNEIEAAFDAESDVTKKDSLYTILEKHYPPTGPTAEINLDYKRLALAIGYLTANDMAGFKTWMDRVKDKSGLPDAINSVAANWANNGEHLEHADYVIQLAMKMLDSLYKKNYAQMFLSPEQVKANNRDSYYQCADTYALILYKGKSFLKALNYEKQVYERTIKQDSDINVHYAHILNANGMYIKAADIIKKSFSAGAGSEALKIALKQSYMATHGNDKDFPAYLNSLTRSDEQTRLAEMAKNMVNKPAADFDLSNLAGNHVSLSSLKGKIIIIDFWANWCAPCKASFPGMQAAINKYKNDPNVQFLFIDTWENGNNYMADTRKYMDGHQFHFNVLFDDKAADGRMSKTRTAYAVEGLPTKIVIDAHGNTRFVTSGYPGSSQALLEEIDTMIALCKQD